MKRLLPLILLVALALKACIPTDNPVIDTGAGTGGGTPDITQCAVLGDVLDGKDYVPQSAPTFDSDGRQHPDIFYIGWSQLDQRNDLRFPTNGYSGDGFEDKLLVSRELEDGTVRSWQLLPMLDDNCEDTEKIRIHSFDVAPDGQSLFVSMRREGDTHLAIYEFDFTAFTFRKITNDNSTHFLNPTYVGDDPQTGHHILFVSKSVQASELPLNYGGPTDGVLVDEYDRDATPLIHILNAETGDVQRIGFNNSHQTEPLAIDLADGTRLVVFTQWEHQQTTNRFALWKIQVDGSDNFTFFGQESAIDRSAANIFQAREIKSGSYAGYILMAQGRSGFVADGSIMMTRRHHFDLRSERIALELHDDGVNIGRNPEHYNDASMVYAYRESKDNSYGIYLKDYPVDVTGATHTGTRKLIISHDDLHFVQPRSFYPPAQRLATTGEGTIGESRTSFTNLALGGNAGFLVQNLTQSDNGVQHQTDGMNPADLSMQFFVPSHTIQNRSEAVGQLGWGGSPELSVPSSGFLSLEADGSFGAILKTGLYTWKLYKRLHYQDSYLQIPIRAERQEISFVPDRVNACNQCHQERSQANIDKYDDLVTAASVKMQSANLSGVHDVSGYDTYNAVPDFHRDIMPLFSLPSTVHTDGLACVDCHNARDKLDLSNPTGVRSQNPTWLALVRGAHKLADSEDVLPYISNSINPMGFDNTYGPAPFMWALLLGNDLTEPPAPDFPDGSSRDLTRPGDYGAAFDQRVLDAITTINDETANGYDHTQHWTPTQMQTFISYSTSQSMVGLSDRIEFDTQGSGMTESAAGQKAYQAMVRQCFNCHNDHTSEGVNAMGFGLPQEKRFRSSSDLTSRFLRLVIDSHVAQKGDTAFSSFLSQSNINTSMSRTLSSARDRINFNAPSESQLLVYARCSDPDPLHSNVHHAFCLSETHEDYLALQTWAAGGTAANAPPVANNPLTEITFAEYAEPALVGPITWTDPDGDLAQLFLVESNSSEHTFNDTMLSISYDSFTSAQVQTFAILGDRGEREFEFLVSDGQTNSEVQRVPVTVTSNYIVPQPLPDLPDFQAFYTVRESGELRRIDQTGEDLLVGLIPGYTPDFSTVYRRSDTGWLYFVDQTAQRIIVVDETTAQVVFTIALNHEPNRENDQHQQTVYLIWWRPAEFDAGGNMTRVGRLEGLLESKQSQDTNGDWYIDLGDGEPPAAGAEIVVVPEYLTRIPEADNAVSVYVWCRATFMTQLVANGIDRLNALNLITGKAKNLGTFSFEAKTYQDMDYAAQDYFNMRAVLLSEDGAFYGFNQDLNMPPTLISFDPLERVQVQVPMPDWLVALLNDPIQYATPFVVVPPRVEGHKCPQP